MNTIHSIPSSVGWEDRPHVFYFGYFGDDKGKQIQVILASNSIVCHILKIFLCY